MKDCEFMPEENIVDSEINTEIKRRIIEGNLKKKKQKEKNF